MIYLNLEYYWKAAGTSNFNAVHRLQFVLFFFVFTFKLIVPRLEPWLNRNNLTNKSYNYYCNNNNNSKEQ